MKLHNAEEAIKQAYPEAKVAVNPNWTIERHLINPDFWQKLGKVRGWGRRAVMHQKTWDEMSQKVRDLCSIEVALKEFAPKWFETRMSNGDEAKFWE